MKKLLILFFLLIVVVACSSPEVDERLATVEAIMSEHPDSALMMLDSLDQSQLSSDRQRALYALLYSQALDKNYIDLTTDSIINIAVSYYDNSNDLYHKMLSHYYYGRIMENVHEYAQCMIAMTKAYEIASELNDYFWMGRAAGIISNIYAINSYNAEAINYANIAYHYLNKSGCQPYINYALLAVARAYMNDYQNDTSIVISKQLLDSAALYNDTLLHAYTYRILAKSYFDLKDYSLAVEAFNYLKDFDEFTPDIQCLLGVAYIGMGDMEHAAEVYKTTCKELTSMTTPLAYNFAMANNDSELAAKLLKDIYDDLDSVFTQTKSQHFTSAVSGYYKSEQQLKEEKLKTMRLTHAIILILCCVVLVMVVVIAMRRYRKQQAKIEKNIIIAQNLQEILTLKEVEYTNAQKIIQSLFASKFEVVNRLCQTYYESQPGAMKKRISDEVENIIRNFSSDSSFIEQLEVLVDKHLSGLMHSFKNDLPNLKQADYLLFMYSVLGFSSVAIALFLKEEKIEAVYNRKARLKSKIKKLGNDQKELYLSYLL